MQKVDPASASSAAVDVEDVSTVCDDAEAEPSNLQGAELCTSVGTCGISEACHNSHYDDEGGWHDSIDMCCSDRRSIYYRHNNNQCCRYWFLGAYDYGK